MENASGNAEAALPEPAPKRPWFKRPGCLIAGTVTLAIPVGLIGFVAWCWHYYPAHQHCSKNTSGALRGWAAMNFGVFPTHTNGFGDALLLLVRSNCAFSIVLLTAPGDDGSYYAQALRTGGDVPEDRCSRMYIQGLCETNWGVAVIFDRYPTPGGDHGRRPWGPLMRDVIFADGGVQFLLERDWAALSRQQIELLVKLGFPREKAQEFYRPFPGPIPK